MKKDVYFHLLFWITYMAIFTFVEGGYNNKFDQAFYMELGYLPLRLVVVYLNYFWLLPQFLLKKRITSYLFYSVATILLASLLNRLFFYCYLNAIIFPGWSQGDFFQAYKFLQSSMIITSPMIFLIGLVVMKRWVSSERRAQLLESEKIKAELGYLRSQINPHFFFNTLNTLYGLALKKSDRTPEVVMQLSELMSYILYEADKELVPLSKEIDQIERYIELEQIRYENRFETDIEVNGDVELCQIPPLILLPFVENSFKHGVNKSSKDGWISIRITSSDGGLEFIIQNKVFDETQKKEGKNGLGIANVKRRLNLLYPGSHTLSCKKLGDIFTVHITIHKTI
ncbi:MAG: histidine kinase [Imperialibacter sp.]|uniref:sensor histidine kinase n=1 Tax=Imperialibacter sp. TaxID=2038411 RepID=UPI0032EAE218